MNRRIRGGNKSPEEVAADKQEYWERTQRHGYTDITEKSRKRGKNSSFKAALSSSITAATQVTNQNDQAAPMTQVNDPV